jgi:hypothetical protein
MKYITIIICFFILPIFSLQEIKPKICINCKYFLTDNKTGKFGRCSLFPIKEKNNNFLINGIVEDEINPYEYYTCSIARNYDNMCGIEGKMHKRKYNKKT